MNFLQITEQYYSAWLGMENAAAHRSPGSSFLYNKERNAAQIGYGQPFDLWIWKRGQAVTVSYGDRAAESIPILRERLQAEMTAEEILALLSQAYGKPARRSIKYVYGGDAQPDPAARPLTSQDYPAYLDFFRTCHPSAPDPSDWLPEYFQEMTAHNLCCGTFEGDLLLSCTDAPAMPYLPHRVQEIGIQTLAAFRQRGLATHACRQAICKTVAHGLCPLWSTGADNTASQRLAKRLDFVPLADCITLSL